MKTNDIGKQPWRESGCGRIFASVVLFRAISSDPDKAKGQRQANIEVVWFGLGDDDIHVKRVNNNKIQCVELSRIFFAGQLKVVEKEDSLRPMGTKHDFPPCWL